MGLHRDSPRPSKRGAQTSPGSITTAATLTFFLCRLVFDVLLTIPPSCSNGVYTVPSAYGLRRVSAKQKLDSGTAAHRLELPPELFLLPATLDRSRSLAGCADLLGRWRAS